MKQLGLFIDMDRCIGCKTCVVACRNYHELVDHKNATPGNIPYYLRVESRREGVYPAIAVDTWIVPCQHCKKPPCLKACKTGAITKDEATGIVRIDRSRCDGDGACVNKCPYKVIQFDEEHRYAHKCNLCEERITVGKEPVCAETCMTDAIHFGEKELLEEMAVVRGLTVVKKMSTQAVVYAKRM